MHIYLCMHLPIYLSQYIQNICIYIYIYIYIYILYIYYSYIILYHRAQSRIAEGQQRINSYIFQGYIYIFINTFMSRSLMTLMWRGGWYFILRSHNILSSGKIFIQSFETGAKPEIEFKTDRRGTHAPAITYLMRLGDNSIIQSSRLLQL